MGLKLNDLKSGDLDQYEGTGPDTFCNTGLVTESQNHCAHFVCHALDLKIGSPLCGDMKFSTRHQGVTMRVNDVFNYCTIRGYLDEDGEVPDAVSGFSAFFVIATIPGNLTDRSSVITMGDNPRKHIGIYLDDAVWNFSNGHHKVVRDSLGNFIKKMKHAYGPDTKFLYAYRQDI